MEERANLSLPPGRKSWGTKPSLSVSISNQNVNNPLIHVEEILLPLQLQLSKYFTMSAFRASREALRLCRPRSTPIRRSIFRAPSRSVATYTPPNQANAISVLPTLVDPSSSEYKENARQMGEVMSKLEELTKKIHLGGPPKAREKHVARKKMLPRDRVTALIDPGTSFLELSALAGHGVYPEAEVPSGGIITGVGVIEGVTCMVVANDSTVKGGTYYPITVKKHLRAQAIAQENNLP